MSEVKCEAAVVSSVFACAVSAKTLCFALATVIDGGSGHGREWCLEAVKAFVKQAREITRREGNVVHMRAPHIAQQSHVTPAAPLHH